MKRKRKYNLIDEMLFAEEGIRRAVQEKRQEISFYRTSRIDGGGGSKSKMTDATGGTALKHMREIPLVVVAGVGTIPFPEKWLQVFDRVREYIAQCARPDLILHAWEWRYRGGGEYVATDCVDDVIDDETYKPIDGGTIALLRWIRATIREEAQKEGLL